MKLGIYGGSFDPVHLGHLLVAQAAIEELGLDRLFFIPAAQSPFKPDSRPAPASARLQLLRLALAGRTNCGIDEQEIRRGGVSYTVDTLRDYAKKFPGAELFYLIGADHVAKLNQWREARRVGGAGGVCRHTAAGRSAGQFPAAVPRPVAQGISARDFVGGNPGAGEGGFARRTAGAASRGRGHPQRKTIPLIF